MPSEAAGPVARAFSHRDFRLLWAGAFLSFIGSWIQTVGQGYLVFEITGNKELLARVAFFAMLPVSLIGPFAGVLADTLNKRNLLIATQLLFAASAGFLAAATHFGFVQYWHIVIAALVVGLVGAFEMPTRQSIVSRVVPLEDLPAAIPLNALTFNLARLVGPAIGGVLLLTMGVEACYLANAISYIALVFAAMAIRSDLTARAQERQPMLDLVLEGARYIFADRTLRALFLLECTISVFGIFYLPLIPAIAKEMLGQDKLGLFLCYSAIGVGSVAALLLITNLSQTPKRALVIRVGMTVMGFALIGLAGSTHLAVALPLFAILGLCAIAQFNTTNTLFQLLSPDRLRGRVLSMHVWALAGISPLGVIFFGWFAEAYSLRYSLALGGVFVLIGALAAWRSKRGLEGVV